MKFDKCPHCGSTEGVYTKTNLTGVRYNMNFDGSEGDNRDMYDNAEKVTAGRMVYCQSCNKTICRWDTFKLYI